MTRSRRLRSGSSIPRLLASTPCATAGKAVWADNCAGCHGLAGTGGNGGPSLVDNPNASDPAKVREQVTNGGGGMPAFKDTLTQQQINNVAAYVSQDIAKE